MTAHPVDSDGRILPEPGWPSDRAAPGALELVRRFCNSINRENGADRFTSRDGFDAWLVAERHHPTRPAPDDLARIVTFRDALSAHTRAHQRRRPAAGAWHTMAAVLADTVFVAHAVDDGLDLTPTSTSPTAAFLGELALTCMRAHRDGTFQRLKSCAHCQWTIYDNSKNQSGRWCTMAACGGRQNAKNYRRRQRT